MKYLSLIALIFSFNSFAFCLQTMNVYGVWTKDDIFRNKLRTRNRNLVEAIKKDDPCDFYFYQEVWTGTSESILKKGLKSYKFNIIKNENEPAYTTGLAFSSKLKAKTYGQTFFRNAPGSDGDLRDLPFVKIKKGFNVVETNELAMINLHLQPMGGSANYDEIKATQISHVLDIIKYVYTNSLTDKPLVLLGDFNNSPGSLTFKLLYDVLGMKDSYLKVNDSYQGQCTYCGKYKLRSNIIDYILIRDSAQKSFEISKSKINLKSSKNNFISDHAGVRTVFSLVKREQANKKANKILVQGVLQETKSFLEGVKGFEREVKITAELMGLID